MSDETITNIAKEYKLNNAEICFRGKCGVDDLIDAIEVEKEKNTDFYSLVIGTSGNQGTIDCFNHNWSYNTNDIHASRHLVEQLHSIKMRPTSQGLSDNADK